MIIVGEAVGTKMKVTGIYKEGSTTISTESIEIPEPINMLGKESALYINTETNEFFYEYTDRPLTESERVTQLEEENALIKAAMDDLIMNGSGF